MGPVLMLVFIPVSVIALIAGYLVWWFRKEERQRQQQYSDHQKRQDDE